MKKLNKIISALLAIMFCITCIPFAVFAAETESEAPECVWYGDKVAVDVTAGEEGYTFMSLFRKYVHGYEFGGHFMGEGEGPQTFVIIDTVAHDGKTWTPDGTYVSGSSNYEVVYCCDVETMIEDGVYYKRMNLEDSEYYDEARAQKLRAIVTNSYPYVSVEEMKASLVAAGVKGAADLTRNEIIAAVQTAVWAQANTEGVPMRYTKSYKVSDNLQWGYPMYDTSAESGLDVAGKRVFQSYPEVGERIDALVDYLLSLEATHADLNTTVVTNLEILDCTPVIAKDDVYTILFKVELNHSGREGDNLSLDITVDGEKAAAETVVPGTNEYSFTVEAKAGQTINATLSGEQYLNRGVYFYAPKPADDNGDGVATSREVSQNLIGVAGGMTPVYCEKQITVPKIDGDTADLRLHKVDNKGNSVAGAEFTLYAESENGLMEIGTYAVDANGEMVVEDLLPGKYEIKETKVPFGYIAPENVIKIELDKDGKMTVVEGDNAEIVDGAEQTLVVENTPETVIISGEKTWDDADNQDGKRPESITINLLANGVVVDTKTVTEADGWKWSFEGVNKYENGEEIVYSITEETVDGYETTVDGFNVTNTYAPEKIEISGEKTWNDDGNRDGIRPESITINLLANGVVVDTKTVTEADGWAWSFAGLNKFENGEEIVYTITEDAVAGYTTVIDGYNVTNTHESEKTTVSGAKTWDDADNADGIRPESITINLLANGVVADTKTVTEADGWAWSFAGLNKFENGEEIVYTITEDAVAGYETVVDGYNVTNVHVPEEIIIEDPEVPLAPPATGDLTSLGMWIMMTAVSGGAALTLMVAGKKKEEREANN